MLPDLAAFEDKADDLAEALHEFVLIERFVSLGEWQGVRHAPPERRVLMGETLLARYCVADQEPEAAERNREHQRRQRLRQTYAQAGPGKLSKTQAQECQWSPAGLRLRLRLVAAGLDCDLHDALTLSNLREGDRLNIFLDSADGFHLQDDVTKPMIFVSVGTGFAPMRAFLWERLALKQAGAGLAEAALFNGIRSSSLDYIYRDEVARFTAERVLDHVHIATSREQPGRREYVQDSIREQGALVWRLLTAEGYVYVCGSQPMRDAVRAAFVDVVAQHGSLPRGRAEAYIDELETTAHYRPDLWG